MDSNFDTVAALVLEFLDRKQEGAAVDAETFRARLATRELQQEFMRLLHLYDHVDQQLADLSPLKAGAVIGDYRVVEQLGRGGMGIVYLAEQITLKRRVALKILPQHLVANERALERFRREILSLARLRHHHLVQVYDAGSHEGMPYFVMEYVEGLTLHEVFEALRDRAPDSLTGEAICKLFKNAPASAFPANYIEAVVRLIAGVADALQYAHDNGVLHRDVKPQNILVANDGAPLLFDFGLARETGAVTLTRTGELAGSPYYVAPEQVRKAPKGKGVPQDRRIDVYALGVTLYEGLTLRIPFEGASTEQVLRAILQGDPPPMRTRNARVPAVLERICRKAMDRDPEWRYLTAAEFADDLRRFLAAEPVSPRLPGINVRAARWMQKHPILATAMLAIVIGAGAWQAIEWKREGERVALAKANAARAIDAAQAKLLELRAQIELEAKLDRQVGNDDDELVYRSDAERAKRRRSKEQLPELNDAIGQRASEVQSLLKDAERDDHANTQVADLRIELDLRMHRYHGEITLAKKDEARIRSGEVGAHLRVELDEPVRLAITAEPADADVYLYRYLAQSKIRRDGEPRLVPVPWGKPRDPVWPADARYAPGDPCLVITAVEEGGQGAACELAPGDLVIALNGRPSARGVWVTQVAARGLAAGMGLAVGDCLTRQGDFEINDLYDVSSVVLMIRFEKAPGLLLTWQSLSERGWATRTGTLPSSKDWVRVGGCKLGNLDEVLSNGELGIDAELTVVHEGEVRSIPWPAHTRLAITSHPTAYALLDTDEARLGRSPRNDLELEPGSYLLVLRCDGFEELRMPVHLVSRARPQPLHLLMKPVGSAPNDFVWIPPTTVDLGDADRDDGHFHATMLAGYWVARHELTVGEYLEFMNDSEVRARIDRGLAANPRVLDLLPREQSGKLFSELSLTTPFTTLEPPDLPASGTSQLAARAYCEWRSRQLRRQGWRGGVRLPTHDEWENAARGPDLRPWTFGETLDAAFARLTGSRPEPYCKAPVGVFLRDESVYGIRDMAGNVMEWTDADGEVRGGYYSVAAPIFTRVATRLYAPAVQTQPTLGFRLVWVPDDAG